MYIRQRNKNTILSSFPFNRGKCIKIYHTKYDDFNAELDVLLHVTRYERRHNTYPEIVKLTQPTMVFYIKRRSEDSIIYKLKTILLMVEALKMVQNLEACNSRKNTLTEYSTSILVKVGVDKYIFEWSHER